MPRILSTAAAAGLALASISVLAPTAGAVNSAPFTENKSFDYTCAGTEYETLGGRTTNNGAPAHAIVNSSQTNVTYPREVSPGQAFSVYVQPGTWKTTGEEMGNAKYDIALPPGVAVTGVSSAGGQSGISQKNGSLKVERVGADGNPSASGGFARIWGQSTVNNGGKQNTNDPKNGIYSVQRGSFRFPTVKIDLVAPATAGKSIDVGLRGAGSSAEISGINSVLSFGLDKRDGLFGADNFNNDDYWCTSPASTGKLTSTRVIGSTTAALTTTDLHIETGTVDTRLAASVTSNASSPAPINEGEVEFFVDGVSIGRAPVVNGSAETTHTFPPLDDRNPEAHEVTAKYLGVPNKFESSADSQTTATVDPAPKAVVTTETTLTANKGAVSQGNGSVTLTATLDPSDGLDLPLGAKVEFLRDGEKIAEAPVTGVTASYTDSFAVPQSEGAKHTYVARFLGFETDDNIYEASAETEPQEVVFNAEFTTSAEVHVSPATVLVGHAATVSATLSANGAPIPTGSSVTFRANGRDIGTATTDDDGTAILAEHVFTAPGRKSIVAVFAGRDTDDGRYLPVTSEPTDLIVEDLPNVGSQTVLDLSAMSTVGDEVLFTATVTREDGSDLTSGDVEDLGSVWFYRDGEAIASAPVTIDPVTKKATATFKYRFEKEGSFDMTAQYSGATIGEEVVTASDTDEATTISVKPNGVVIKDPESPTDPKTPTSGSLDLGSLSGISSDSSLFGSLAPLTAGS
ncbi:Ig-like domain-containing protein [Dietzia sp.]|uniref:Ig-like domain-containing protein n=1 Tax=Dietzia sp. TaxID=1871616 RepID=UPI002FDACC8D